MYAILNALIIFPTLEYIIRTYMCSIQFGNDKNNKVFVTCFSYWYSIAAWSFINIYSNVSVLADAHFPTSSICSSGGAKEIRADG